MDNASASGGEYMQPVLTDLPPFSTADLQTKNILKFENELLEIVEELRVRRISDVESEQRMKQLVSDQYDLEKKVEELNQSLKNAADQHSQKLHDAKRQFDEKLQANSEEKFKDKFNIECLEKQVKAMKDELKSLQVQKYSLEKRVREQEKKLEMQTAAKDMNISQQVKVEAKYQEIKRHFLLLKDAHNRLEQNVNKCITTNKNLEYLTQHKNCLLKLAWEKNDQLKEETIQLRVQLQSKPYLSSVMEDSKLQLQIEMKDRIISQLKDEQNKLKEIVEENSKSLKSANDLVLWHVAASKQSAGTEVCLRDELTTVKKQLEKAKVECSKCITEKTNSQHPPDTQKADGDDMPADEIKVARKECERPSSEVENSTRFYPNKEQSAETVNSSQNTNQELQLIESKESSITEKCLTEVECENSTSKTLNCVDSCIKHNIQHTMNVSNVVDNQEKQIYRAENEDEYFSQKCIKQNSSNTL